MAKFVASCFSRGTITRDDFLSYNSGIFCKELLVNGGSTGHDNNGNNIFLQMWRGVIVDNFSRKRLAQVLNY